MSDLTDEFLASLPVEPEADTEPTPGDFPEWTDMRDFWELAEAEIPCVFDQALPRGELGVLASEPGLAKTTFALGLGASVVLFKSMLCGFTPQRPGRVALLLGEDGKHPISKRLRAWAEARGVSRKEVESALADGRLKMVCGESAAFLALQGGGLAETRAYTQFREMCEAEQFDLVVIDSLLEWTNVDNENDNATMHNAAKALIRLAKASGGAVLALCHTNKAGDKTGEAALHSIRGGGALAAKVRWAGLLLKLSDAEAKAYRIPEAERPRYVSFREIKNQYHPLRGAPSYFERAEGGVLEGVRLVPPTREEEFEELAGLLADNLGDNPRNLPKWELLTGPRGKVFRAELKLKCARATIENLKLSYELALKMGLIHEAEEGDLTGGATAKIPRKTGKAL